MNSALAVVIAVCLFLGSVIWAALADMFKDEIRTRLGRLPYLLIRVAALRIPAADRSDLTGEWDAELDLILHRTDGLPISRLLRGVWFSADLLLRGAPGVAREIKAAMRDTAGNVARRGTGQRFQLDQEMRVAVEARAMNVATEFYNAQGWTVQDVHGTEGYDLICRRGGEVKHVEVKGTMTAGAEVILTPNEIRHARESESAALFVLSNITDEPADDGTVTAAGGRRHRNDAWHLDEGTLTPLIFRYQVPGLGTEDT
jgi:hypothetical protein